MTTTTLTSGNDTVDLIIGLDGSINGANYNALAGTTVDAGAGTDLLTVDDRYSTSHFSVGIADTGVVTLTTASGSTSFSNFEKIQFRDVTLDLGSINGDNLVSASANGDILYGFSGNDTMGGGAGADTMYGGLGNDTYTVNSSGDQVIEAAGQGIDKVLSSISYTLGANVEQLTLTGVAALSAKGNALANTIVGNAGADTITGGAGHDVMTGGAGKDQFVFATLKDTTTVAATRDVITDFKSGTDKIDLHLIDANIKLANDQAFKLMPTLDAAFTGVAGQLHYVTSGANTVIEGDINGDKVADFQIQLTGHIHLVASDFVL